MVPRRRRWSSRIHYEPHPTRSEPTSFTRWNPRNLVLVPRRLNMAPNTAVERADGANFLAWAKVVVRITLDDKFKKCTEFSQQIKPLLSTGVKCQDYNGSFFPRGTRWQVWDAAAPNTKVLAVDCNISPPFGGGIVLKSFTAVLLLFPRWDMCVFEKGHLLSLWKFAAKRSLT